MTQHDEGPYIIFDFRKKQESRPALKRLPFLPSASGFNVVVLVVILDEKGEYDDGDDESFSQLLLGNTQVSGSNDGDFASILPSHGLPSWLG